MTPSPNNKEPEKKIHTTGYMEVVGPPIPVGSTCCKAPLKLCGQGTGEGVTHWYTCTKCNEVTDMVELPPEPSKGEHKPSNPPCGDESCTVCNSYKPLPSSEKWGEKAIFDSKLAFFIDFVESEAKRIDEERRGAHRRDGGRKMQCALFLKALLSQEKEKSYREGLEDVERWLWNNGITDKKSFKALLQFLQVLSEDNQQKR